MQEEIDTTGEYPDNDIPDGTYSFRVKAIRDVKKGIYAWDLEYEGIVGSQIIPVFMMGDLLRLLGCKEISKNKFLWDKEMLTGQTFTATVSHERDKKDATKVRQQMRDFKKSNEQDETPY
jgi:hypothetical protein